MDMMATHTEKEVHRESDSSCQSADDVKDPLLVQTSLQLTQKNDISSVSSILHRIHYTHSLYIVLEATIHYAPSQYLSVHTCVQHAIMSSTYYKKKKLSA